MKISEKLQKLTKIYSEKKNFNLQELELKFMELIAETLTEEGLEEATIKKISKRLFLLFHTDKSSLWSPEIKWLESTLSLNKQDGTCFKLIKLCEERLLKNQQENKEYQSLNTLEDFQKRLEVLKKQSTSSTQSILLDNFISCLEQFKLHKTEVDKVNVWQLQMLMHTLPILCTSSLTLVFYKEIAALYTISLVLRGTGKAIEDRSGFFGKSLKDLSNQTIHITTTAVVSILQLNLWMSTHCYQQGLEAAGQLLKTFTSPALVERSFKTKELILIATIFENYQQKNQQQCLRPLRIGESKFQETEYFLNKLEKLEKNTTLSKENKLLMVAELLSELKTNKSIYTKKLKNTIDEAILSLRLADEPVITFF